MVEPIMSLDTPINNDNASTPAQMDLTAHDSGIEEDRTTMTELATEAISPLSSFSEEAVMIRTKAGKDGRGEEEGVVEVAAEKVLVIRTDVLEPVESWIRAWLPLRSGSTKYRVIPLKISDNQANHAKCCVEKAERCNMSCFL
jgi:hypothetical protein